MVFTWLTRGENFAERRNFLNARQTLYDTEVKPIKKEFPYSYQEPLRKMTVTVTKSFQEKVNSFLKGNQPLEVARPGIVDAVHGIESAIIGLALTKSKWKYVSGNEVNITIGTPAVNIGPGGGAGYYYFFSEDSPNKYYPLKFEQLFISAGLNAILLPFNVSINPSFLPSAGTLFHGWETISTPSQLNGLYFFLSGSVALIGNLNTSLIFFLPVGTRIPNNFNEIAKDSALLLATILTNVMTSKAVMAVTGHGIEATFGVGVAAGYGYANVGKPINR